ncbi:hypothetical protein Daura_30305 [Dactylosporangium aurantiacum]|uniref:Uncharacterized protein n=1 Tax=Dactylosporangium aurantiacum TaxID=35754 RepID=A0A9Q9MFZ1_9ACTN|nr:hypothetical protein [Dactylosporangium aurantiacum]MDG6110529.1 hypothetical protein [Dactylosporangium aurantiacum]UWZ51056.1 hypothetical protein Daura_30305 [Dactylosporangium aurantiacum]
MQVVIVAAVAVAVAVLAVAAVSVLRHRDAGDAQATGAATAAAQDVPDPTVRAVGDPIEVPVAPEQPFSVVVPDVGHLTAPAGAFASAGKVVLRRLAADAPDGSLVELGGTGVDVSFSGTSLRSPITITFDDPASGGRLPAGALPVMLHQASGGGWETRVAAGGPPQLVTTDFSPNLFGWIRMPDWVKGIGDSIADYATQRTDPRACPGGAPKWSSVNNKTTLVHLCAVTNTDASSKAVRAELQVQSNRRFFQWVNVAPGADYLWVADEQDWFRMALAKVSKRDKNRDVLIAGNGWLTAGYRQPEQSQAKAFNASLDYWSAGFSVGGAILGLDPRDTVQGSLLIVVQCADKLRTFPSFDSAKDFVRCFIEQSLTNLANPDKAFSQAVDLFGEAGYSTEAEQSLRKAITRLRFLGRLLKVIGVAGVITSTFSQLPDAFSQWGRDQPGAFTLQLSGSAASVTTFRTVDPWRDGSAGKAAAGQADADSSCIPSELASRRDGFRCFIGNDIYDPCFASGSDYLCAPLTMSGTWTKFTGVPRDAGFVNDGEPGRTDVFAVKLANGAECHRRSGSGPPGVPGYPYWVGGCSGGPFGDAGLIWRIGDGTGSAPNYPLYPTDDPKSWTAAVETAPGKVERLPVILAWR